MLSALGAGTGAAYHVVAALARLLAPLPGGFAAAAAIVLFTAAVRLLLLPLSFYAMRGQAAQARLLPQVAELKRRHAAQPDRLQRELAELYRRERSGLTAGCLPLLLQLPFFAVMYRLFRSPTVAGTRNGLLAHTLFGAPLSAHWLAAGPLSGHGLVFAGLFALLALVGWAAARPAGAGLAQATGSPPAHAALWMSRVMPYSTVVIAAFVPLAAGLYLLTSAAWTAAERRLLRRAVTARTAVPRPDPAPPA